jgi:hypothetical protein
VTNVGTAVDTASKCISGHYLGYRAVRWDATSATVLGDLGTDASGDAYVVVHAGNNSGTAAGEAYKFVSGFSVGSRAVRWDVSGTAATELGDLGTGAKGVSMIYASAINNAGTIVGSADKYVSGFNMGSRAVRWDASGTAATELGSLRTDGGPNSAGANAINDTGTIVGFASKSVSGTYMGHRAVRWDASGTTATELGNLGTYSSGYSVAQANAINNVGTAVGQANKYVSGVYVGNRAVRWDASGTDATELGNLGTDASGTTKAYAIAINNAGTAIGRAEKYVAGADKGERAVRWDASGTAATELGLLGTNPTGNSYSEALALNNAGAVVGAACLYDALGKFLGDRAVMWGLDGTAVNLNTLIDPDSGWTLCWARGISDTGWISGGGLYDPDGSGPLAAYDRLFIMQVPEPTTLAMFAFGLLAAAGRRRSLRTSSARGGSSQAGTSSHMAS